MYKNPFEKGHLIIQFLVNFPVRIPPEVIPALENCLPPRPRVSILFKARVAASVRTKTECRNRAVCADRDPRAGRGVPPDGAGPRVGDPAPAPARRARLRRGRRAPRHEPRAVRHQLSAPPRTRTATPCNVSF